MPSQRRWRQRLLGSLQGQLQLATYLVVFAGFTGASTAGLWVGQRNLIHNETQTLRSSASAMQASLRSDQSARANANGANAIEQLQLELLVHSSHRTRLWIEQPDGSLILPERGHLKINADDASYENDYKTAAPYYSSQNKNRIKPLIVNATSVKLMSDWMKILSEQTSGNYLQSQ